MAKIVKTERLVASNGAIVVFDDWPMGSGLPRALCFKLEYAHWPLDEFDELVEYVNKHRENLEQAEVQTEG